MANGSSRSARTLRPLTKAEAQGRARFATANEGPIFVGRTSRGARYSCPRCRQLLVTGFDRRAVIPPAVAFWCRCGQLSEVP